MKRLANRGTGRPLTASDFLDTGGWATCPASLHISYIISHSVRAKGWWVGEGGGTCPASLHTSSWIKGTIRANVI